MWLIYERLLGENESWHAKNCSMRLSPLSLRPSSFLTATQFLKQVALDVDLSRFTILTIGNSHRGIAQASVAGKLHAKCNIKPHEVARINIRVLGL